ncbi:MAG: VWA-like domain-containing protein, partial [Eubacterium sp.]
ILMQERFLDSAIFSLHPAASSEVTEDYMVDGQAFQYNPSYVVSSFQKEKNAVGRAFLHALLHVLFLHPFAAGSFDPALWDLSCDIAAEGIILSQKKSCFALEQDEAEQKVIDQLQDQIGMLTAEQLYHHLLQQPLTKEKRRELSLLFHQDSHDSWYINQTLRDLLKNQVDAINNYGKPSRGASRKPEGGNDSLKAEDFQVFMPDKGSSFSGSEMNPSPGGLQNSAFSGLKYGDDLPYPLQYLEKDQAALVSTWTRRSDYVLSRLEEGSSGRSAEAGWLMQELREVKRKPADYREFLRKFARQKDAVKPSMDEFNPILYSYGLKLYGNLPLIEESETSRKKKISEFIIALDTSGSTAGSLVQEFLQQTCDILMDKEMFSERMNLHILQCDAAIQEVMVIRHKSEIEKAVSQIHVKGMGGTDFRPVFSYAEQMKREGKFSHLQGLLYFTDGRGVYPKKKPEFKTAFVFLRNELDAPKLPPWAYKVIWEQK